MSHTIHLKDNTFDLMMSLKHDGQTADGFIYETLKRLVKQNHRGIIINGGDNGQSANQAH